MRPINNAERKKRGCEYCHNMIPRHLEGKTWKPRRCPYEECPYHELDASQSYDQFMLNTDSMGIVRALEALG